MTVENYNLLLCTDNSNNLVLSTTTVMDKSLEYSFRRLTKIKVSIKPFYFGQLNTILDLIVFCQCKFLIFDIKCGRCSHFLGGGGGKMEMCRMWAKMCQI